MNKLIIWGSGSTGKSIMNAIDTADSQVIAFIDSDESKWNNSIQGIKIIPPHQLIEMDYDAVIIGTIINPADVKAQLIRLGVPDACIDSSYVEYQYKSRIQWLSDLAKILKNEPGSVAEAGVYKGDFAKYINKYFKDKKLYLFDTFSGFDERDLKKYEVGENAGHLNNTSEDEVMSKMPYPQNCIIKKGYFPESAKDVSDQFCFVNLDMDLYKPTLEGLRFFSHRMTNNGVILIHDYFNASYGESIQKAISEFISERPNEKYKLLPVGDSISIAILRLS